MKVLSLLLHLIISLTYLDAKIRVKFNGSCLKWDRSTYTHGKIVHLYIVYEITLFSYPNGGTGRNVIIFGVDMSSSTKTNNKKKRYFNFW